MRGVTAAILEKLADGAWGVEVVVETILASPPGTSLSTMLYRMDRSMANIERIRIDLALRKQIRSTISVLKKEGLVAKSGAKEGRRIWLTHKGQKRWEKIKKRQGDPLPKRSYRALPGATLLFISFDIPESERHKRQWLCYVLEKAGFRRIQKSVFAGKMKVPRELVEDLVRLHLEGAVEIVAITRSGTLRSRSLG